MFKKIKAWLNRLFGKAIQFIKPKAELAVKIVNIIKSVVDSHVVGAIVNLTNTDIDNKILDKVKEVLNKIAPKLTVVRILNENKTHSEILSDLVDYLKSQNSKIQASVYIVLAGELTKALSDDEISFEEAIAISQIVYKEIKSS